MFKLKRSESKIIHYAKTRKHHKMWQKKQQDLANLESEVNCLQREREVLDREWETKRRQLMDQMRIATPGQRSDVTVELINQLAQLNNEFGRKRETINQKINETRQAYSKKLQE